MSRKCAHCGGSFETVRNGLYCCSACRTAAWKARHGYADPRKRGASRNGGAQRKRQPEVRLTYAKAIEAAGRAITAAAGLDGEAARECAEFWLSTVLTDKQRAALQRREGSTA